MSTDVWTLVVVALVYIIVYVVIETGRRLSARKTNWGFLFILLLPLMTVATGWMVMVLWNMSLPAVTGLPTLELIPAIALGWLAGILFRGVAPRAVYDVDREADR